MLTDKQITKRQRERSLLCGGAVAGSVRAQVQAARQAHSERQEDSPSFPLLLSLLPETVPGPYSMKSLERKNRAKAWELGQRLRATMKVMEVFKSMHMNLSLGFLLLVAFLMRKKLKPVTFAASINLVRHTKFSL